MAEQTTNLHLLKPEYSESGDVDVINDNMDIIDGAVKDIQDNIDTVEGDITSLDNSKIDNPDNVAEGKFLQTNENGEAVWGDPFTDEAVETAVDAWMTAHAGVDSFTLDPTLTGESSAAQAKAAGDGIKNAMAMSAPVFNASNAYSKGQYVTYNGVLYLLTADHTATTTWENTSKTAVTTGAELSDLKSALGVLYDYQYVAGAYADVNGKAVLRTFSPYSVYKNVKFNCLGYSSLVIKTYAANSMKIYAVDEELTIKGTYETGSQSATALSTVTVSTIPSGTKYILIPCYEPSGYTVTITNLNVRDEIDKAVILVEEKINQNEAESEAADQEIKDTIGQLYTLTYQAGAYVNLNLGGVAKRVTDLNPFALYKCAMFDVLGYSSLTVKTYAANSVPCIAVDNNMNVLGTYATGAQSATDLSTVNIATIPTGSKYVLINCYDSTGLNAEIVGVTVRKEIDKAIELSRTEPIDGNRLNNFSVPTLSLKDIEHYKESNYINSENVVYNAYVSASGEIVPYSPTADPQFNATGIVYLEENTVYYTHNIFTGYYAFFESDGTLIEGHGADTSLTNPFTTPADTAYAMFTVQGSPTLMDEAWIFTENKRPFDYGLYFPVYAISNNSSDNPCDYNGDEISTFRKCLCIGDSYTEGGFNADGNDPDDDTDFADYSYPTNLAKMVGFETTNMGHGGETAVNWYGTYGSQIPGGHDVCVIFLGINDCVYYGGFGDASKTALGNIITKVEQMNNHIKIFVCTIPRTGSLNTQAIRDSAAIIKNYIAGLNDDDVYVLDLDQYGHLGDATAYNYGHPTAYGYHVLAKDIKNYICWYMSNYPDDFRWIQFINTNKTHDTPM